MKAVPGDVDFPYMMENTPEEFDRVIGRRTDKTPTFLLEDRDGKVHEFDGNDRVVVLARNVEEAHRWIVDQGEHPYGRRFVIATQAYSRRLEGLRFEVLVTLPGFDFNPHRLAIESVIERHAVKCPRLIRIDG